MGGSHLSHSSSIRTFIPFPFEVITPVLIANTYEFMLFLLCFVHFLFFLSLNFIFWIMVLMPISMMQISHFTWSKMAINWSIDFSCIHGFHHFSFLWFCNMWTHFHQFICLLFSSLLLVCSFSKKKVPSVICDIISRKPGTLFFLFLA